MLLRVEHLLHSIYDTVKSYSTEMEIHQAVKVLLEADRKISDPEIKLDSLKPPSTNTNRKGRKAKTGVKSSTERLAIYREIFEQKQEKNIKNREKKEKKEKAEEETKRKHQRMESIKESHLTLSQQKRKITLVMGNADGTVHPVNKKSIRYTILFRPKNILRIRWHEHLIFFS